VEVAGPKRKYSIIHSEGCYVLYVRDGVK
jgi:hypothetical protein